MRIMMAGVALSILVLSGVGVAGVTHHVKRAKAQQQVDIHCDDCGVVVSLDGTGMVTLLGAANPSRIYIRMSDGSLRSVAAKSAPPWKLGDRVRLQDGELGG
jgi:hypothetical protein